MCRFVVPRRRSGEHHRRGYSTTQLAQQSVRAEETYTALSDLCQSSPGNCYLRIQLHDRLILHDPPRITHAHRTALLQKLLTIPRPDPSGAGRFVRSPTVALLVRPFFSFIHGFSPTTPTRAHHPGRTPFGEPLAIRESMRVNTAGSVLIRSAVRQR